ncbi:MAG TPA: hypothetical protein VGN77_02105 [Steroidobacteraceae bacterium]|nr:hypothetical protein [Steroidobacteraceae bacterium]
MRATTSTELDQLLSLDKSVAATPNSGLTRHRNPRGSVRLSDGRIEDDTPMARFAAPASGSV